MKNIIIVPAKGNSTRLPRKNWLVLGDKSLFELALLRAKNSNLGKVAFVSDDEEMLKSTMLPDYKLRISDELAEKRALNSCIWALGYIFGMTGEEFDNIIVTLPTSPLATEEDLQEAYQLFLDCGSQTMASFIEIKGRPKLWRKSWDGKFMSPCPENTFWMDTGVVYISTTENFLKRQEWFDYWVVPYFVDEIEGIDIDTEVDYCVAKAFWEMKQGA